MEPEETVMNTIRIPALATSAAAALVLCLAGAAVPTVRANDMDAPRAIVHIGDLDAKTTSGAEKIFWRLEHASEQVCGDDPAAIRPLFERIELRNCEQKAIAPAVVKINTAPLTTAYYRRYRQPLGVVSVGPLAVG
jgi:UrcA family protein